jgi:hypothetical protein
MISFIVRSPTFFLEEAVEGMSASLEKVFVVREDELFVLRECHIALAQMDSSRPRRLVCRERILEWPLPAVVSRTVKPFSF